MSDSIETALRRLHGQQPPGGFAPADAVRRRGTRRRYRRVAAAAVAVLALAAGTLAWAVDRAGRTVPDVVASPAPSQTSGSPVPSAPPSTTTSPSPGVSPSTRPPVGL